MLALVYLPIASPADTTAPAGRGYYSMSEPRWASPGADSPAVWSRDGREVIFQQTREEGIAQIWAIRPDGSGLRRLTDGTFRAGHPDPCSLDDRLALISDRDGTRQVWVMSLDDGGPSRLTSGGVAKSWPAFSPDCREIVFVELSDPETGRYDLRVVDVASGEVRSLLEAVRYLGGPRWSADGEWVLFHREHEGFPNHLWRIRRDGTGAAPLSGGDHGDYWGPDVSRDGRLLSYSVSRREQLQWGGDGDLWLLDLGSGECRRLTGGWWHEHGQRFSPDGERLVYWDARSGYLELFVLDLEHGPPRQITFQPPTELTRIVRERGSAAALDHARSRPAGEELFSARAMAALLATRAREGRPPEVELARYFVARFPDSRRARAALARELLRAGEPAAARERYRELRADDPASPDVAAGLATLALLEETAGATLAELEAAPPSEAVLNDLGYALLRMGMIDQAIDVLGWNARRHPGSANVHDSLGEALYWRGELETAERVYRRSLELDPANVNATRFLERIRSARMGSPARRGQDPVPCPRIPRVPSWATVLEWQPDPAVVADPDVRRRIVATGAPWRVLHEESGVELLLVPPGSYRRGAAADDPYDRENERPQHRVAITQAFYLGRYEVTNAQLRRFRPDHDSGGFYRAEDLTLDDDDMPAVDVSWLDATAFAEHFGFRLPSEAEWEYAARAGVESRYPWGNDPNAGEGWGNGFNEAVKRTIPAMDWEAFSWDDGFIVSSPAGSFRPNAWGFYDLFGNAWEWCLDVYRETEYRRHVGGAVDPVAAAAPAAEGEELRRTLRGGGWGNAPRGSGIPYRFGMIESDRFDGNGFRVVRPLRPRASATTDLSRPADDPPPPAGGRG